MPRTPKANFYGFRDTAEPLDTSVGLSELVPLLAPDPMERSDHMDPDVAAGTRRLMVLRGTLLALVRRDGRDLTARQLTVFLTIYGDHVTQTVSSLAEFLNVARPGMTRVLDRLVEFNLVAREEDSDDRRRVLVRRTAVGLKFFEDLAAIALHIDP